MGAMFRSEEMALCQLFIQPEAAYSCVSALGEKGTVQFRDLNSSVNAYQRKFVTDVRRCDEMDRKLRYIETELKKDEVNIPECEEIPKAPNPREIIDLEARLEKTESEILQLSQNAVNLQTNFLELTEMKHVLARAQVFFAEQGEVTETLTKSLMNEDGGQIYNGRLSFVAGVVERERVPAFERMLWRLSRGNVYLKQSDIEEALQDPTTRNEIFKTAFVAFFQGDQLKARVQKVCAGFHATIFPCPNAQADREDMLKGVKTRLEDLNLVLNQTQEHRQRVLQSVAKQLQVWSVMVKKMKAIYHTLNMFSVDVTRRCLIGEGWVPVSDINGVRIALVDGAHDGGSSIESFLNIIETSEEPPTFIRTNKFTRGFQNLIDAYGISNYREVNPGLYSIITFPFLFAVMFGDLGHGFILFLIGLTLVLLEKRFMNKKNGEVFGIFFGGRYIMLLMGLFSIYTGIVYNDIFSKSMNIFGSSWSVNYDLKTLVDPDQKERTLDPAPYNNGTKNAYYQTPYPLGVDPVWQVATANKIIFSNTFKMKLSIIFGVIHMVFGVCLSVVNHRHFKHYSSIFLEFIPQVLFLVLLFGYLCTLMIIKFWMYSSDPEPVEFNSMCAPSILILFINMMLLKHSEVAAGCQEYMFSGQETLQNVLLIVAIICIPVMLFGKPIYIVVTRRKKGGDTSEEQSKEEVAATSQGGDGEGGHGDGGEDDSFGEIMIYQAIHTIEYVLSTISHTASYLRLWALSLAHAQLSEVAWNMILRQGLIIKGWAGLIVIFLLFAFWSVVTVGILIGMEGLSAFLHTLRLHWVEFMSKFYKGQGYPFAPFSFKHMLMEEEEDG